MDTFKSRPSSAAGNERVPDKNNFVVPRTGERITRDEAMNATREIAARLRYELGRLQESKGLLKK